MIRNWVDYECRPPKQLMMACMLLLEVTHRCPESRKKLATLYKFFPYGCRLRTPNVRGEGGRLNAGTCGQGEGIKNWQNLADIF